MVLILALFRLGFPPAPGLQSLNLAPYRNSQAHSTKGTRSPSRRWAPTACKSMVSGSISLPSPGFFSPFPHGTSALSVAVSYLALEGGPPRFKQGFTCPALLRYPQGAGIHFAYRAFTSCGRPSQCRSAIDPVCNSTFAGPTTPHA